MLESFWVETRRWLMGRLNWVRKLFCLSLYQNLTVLRNKAAVPPNTPTPIQYPTPAWSLRCAVSWIKLYNRLKGGWILFNKAAQWPIRILWVTKQKSSQRSLKATVGGWIEIWSTTDNAARHAAHRPAGWGLRLETGELCAEGRPACQSVCTTSLPLRSPSRVGTGVNCSHDGVRWHDWSTLKDHSLWH